METEELIKLVDGIYKNILDKFNPGARQMINAGKAYLKALHGATAASRLYVDAINKLAKQAQQGTWGGSSDIGAALMKVVEVYKEIQDQQMNILKAFYVDLLVPLETNLEKDTKVVQSEQKRFLQQHKQRSETYSKAAAMMKKQRKKSRGSSKTGLAMDKELKNMQVLEEEKTKLDAFCEQSLKNAMTQERRRYGFVLERQCSLAKHYLSYHNHGVNVYQQNLEKWSEVAKTREFLPDSVENIFSSRIRQISVWQDDDAYSNPRSPNLEDDRMSINSQLRKTKSMDASCLDIRSIGDATSPVTTLSRAKSEYNLNSAAPSHETSPTSRRPKSMAIPPPPQWDTQLARALYAYLSSGENQLSFLEGDVIALIGERNKGWQFGENLRTQSSGWFPLAYTELLDEFSEQSNQRPNDNNSHRTGRDNPSSSITGNNVLSPGGSNSPSGNSVSADTPQSARMFGDTIHLHRSSANAKQIRRAIGSNNIPPPALPAPVPTPSVPYQKPSIPQSQSTSFSPKTGDSNSFQQSPYAQTGMKTSTSAYNFTPPPGPYSTHPQGGRPTANSLPLHMQGKGGKIGGPVGNVSLHSSNDSGFSNDPPPQPEVDYSDDESVGGQTKLQNRREHSNGDTNTKQKSRPMRQSNSSGNLIENRQYFSDDQDMLGQDKKVVKRTKSFWRFGKHNSDDEILAGMALWRHRDLVDVEEKSFRERNLVGKQQLKPVNGVNGERIRRPSRDKSDDSDKTLKADGKKELMGPRSPRSPERRIAKQQMALPPPRKPAEMNGRDDDFEDIYGTKPDVKDEFYEDADDGLIMRTVNRKNILQQYTDSTGPDSETESEITSDDPYDCIVVDDQTQKVKRNGEKYPNVAAIGKKLEKLSKSNKYSPNKDNVHNNQIRNSLAEKNNVNVKNERNNKMISDNENIMQYRDKRSFKTFGVEVQNNENGEKEPEDRERYYHNKRNNESNGQEKRRYYSESIERNNVRGRNYETIDSDVDKRHGNTKEKQEKIKYYAEYRQEIIADELSDVVENKQFLPRTKLAKTNSNNSKSKYNDELTDYGDSLKKRYNEKSQMGGNMYGPWYDLWGLDSSVRK